MRRRIFYFALVLVLTLPLMISCDEISLAPVDCSECYSNEPYYGDIGIMLTINSTNPEVLITIYEGKYDDKNVVYSELFSRDKVYISVLTNQNYVFKAEYIKNGRPYHVLNSGKLKTKLDYDSCNEACYYIIEHNVDLRIRD